MARSSGIDMNENIILQSVIVFTFALLLAAAAGLRDRESEPPMVEAWRWDAWFGELARSDPEISLALPKCHFRLPYKTEINGDSEEIIEQEIAYAKEASLDYWAFLEFWNQKDPDYTIALRHYRTVEIKRELRYCLVSEGFRLDRVGVGGRLRLNQNLKDPNCRTVLDNRPLPFICRKPKHVGKYELQQLGNAAAAAEHKRPYVILLEGSRSRI
jgi:hypothetical protein